MAETRQLTFLWYVTRLHTDFNESQTIIKLALQEEFW